MESRGLETRVVKRFQYNDEVVRWADIVVTTGYSVIIHTVLVYIFHRDTERMRDIVIGGVERDRQIDRHREANRQTDRHRETRRR